MSNQKYDFKEIGSRIRSERKAAGYKNATGFGEKFGLSRSTIEQIERGQRVPELSTMLQMCNEFNCDLDYLLCQIDAKTRTLTDICKLTGISPKAAENLEKNAYNYYPVLSSILENASFWSFLEVIATYKTIYTNSDYARYLKTC